MLTLEKGLAVLKIVQSFFQFFWLLVQGFRVMRVCEESFSS